MPQLGILGALSASTPPPDVFLVRTGAQPLGSVPRDPTVRAHAVQHVVGQAHAPLKLRPAHAYAVMRALLQPQAKRVEVSLDLPQVVGNGAARAEEDVGQRVESYPIGARKKIAYQVGHALARRIRNAGRLGLMGVAPRAVAPLVRNEKPVPALLDGHARRAAHQAVELPHVGAHGARGNPQGGRRLVNRRSGMRFHIAGENRQRPLVDSRRHAVTSRCVARSWAPRPARRAAARLRRPRAIALDGCGLGTGALWSIVGRVPGKFDVEFLRTRRGKVFLICIKAKRQLPSGCRRSVPRGSACLKPVVHLPATRRAQGRPRGA